MKEERDNYL